MDIRKRVKNLVKKYETSDPFKLCIHLKITVIYSDLGSIKGYYKKYKKKSYIVLNENLEGLAKKIVLAHEIGHSILHNKDIVMMKRYFIHSKDSIYENEANFFANELLSKEIEVNKEEILLDEKILLDFFTNIRDQI